MKETYNVRPIIASLYYPCRCWLTVLGDDCGQRWRRQTYTGKPPPTTARSKETARRRRIAHAGEKHAAELMAIGYHRALQRRSRRHRRHARPRAKQAKGRRTRPLRNTAWRGANQRSGWATAQPSRNTIEPLPSLHGMTGQIDSVTACTG